MASVDAIKAEEARFVRVDKHIRDLLAQAEPVVVAITQSINFLIDGGGAVITTGIKGALRVDYNVRINGSFLQEVDGVTGSIVLDIDTSIGGATPTWTSIVASAPPTITSARFSEDLTLTAWTTIVPAGTYLRWTVNSVASFTRILSVLRVSRI